MKRPAVRLIVLGAAILGVFLLAFVVRPFAQSALWHQRFEDAINRNQEVRLGDLVDFEWDKVFLVRAYDLATFPLRREIFGSEQVYTFSWSEDPRYWTIIYRRAGTSPFIIKMNRPEWGLSRRARLWTTDTSAKLRLVIPGTQDATDCSTRLKRCLGSMHLT
jgi:hypothetical protein